MPVMPNQLSKKEIIQRINHERFNLRAAALVCLPALLLSMLSFRWIDNLFLAALLFFAINMAASGVVTLYVHHKTGRWDASTCALTLRPQIVSAALPEYFQRVQIVPGRKLPWESLQFPFVRGCKAYEVDCYASGMHLTTPVEAELAAVGVMKTYQNTTSQFQEERGTYQQLEPSFEGMIYVAHLQRPFPQILLQTGGRRTEGAQTGDPAFDRVFSLQTGAPEQLMRLLSGSARRFLAETAGKIRGTVYIRFSPGGDVMVAVHQQIYDVKTKKGAEPFEKLDLQLQLFQGLINGLLGGF